MIISISKNGTILFKGSRAHIAIITKANPKNRSLDNVEPVGTHGCISIGIPKDSYG